MSNQLSTIAIKQDLKEWRRKITSGNFKYWYVFIPIVLNMEGWFDSIVGVSYFSWLVVGLCVIIGFLGMFNYKNEKKKITEERAIRLRGKKKNQRWTYWGLGSFFSIAAIFMLINSGFTIIVSLFMLGGIVFLMNAIFYLPCISLEVDGYTLIVSKRGEETKYVDFTFMKALEFTPDSVLFYDNKQDRMILKDVAIDKESILMIKDFLEINYGEEQLKYISNSTSRYYAIT